MNLGFTGTSDLPFSSHRRIEEALVLLVERWEPESVVTGGCVGVDSFVHHWFKENLPDIPRIVVLPGNLKAVDLSVRDSATGGLIQMPSTGKGSSYRDRNEELVRRSHKIVSFWTGQERSGTFMTMNISMRTGKLSLQDIFGIGLPDEEVRLRYGNLQTILNEL